MLFCLMRIAHFMQLRLEQYNMLCNFSLCSSCNHNFALLFKLELSDIYICFCRHLAKVMEDGAMTPTAPNLAHLLLVIFCFVYCDLDINKFNVEPRLHLGCTGCQF